MNTIEESADFITQDTINEDMIDMNDDTKDEMDTPNPEILEEVQEIPANQESVATESDKEAEDVLEIPVDFHNWYMLHTYSGFEARVEQTITQMMRTAQDEGLVHRVLLPTEKILDVGKNGKKRTTTRKLFPGYIMVQMTMTDFSWHLIQNIPKVTGFVGGRNRPAPMGADEVKSILALIQQGLDNPGPKTKYQLGDEVRVVDGPFGGFNGVVEEVNNDKGKLHVSVSIFGRQTSVELDFAKVTKG